MFSFLLKRMSIRQAHPGYLRWQMGLGVDLCSSQSNLGFVCPVLTMIWFYSGKEPTCRLRRYGFRPWVVKIPWRRKCNPLQYSCWEIPQTEEPGWLQSMATVQSKRFGDDYTTAFKTYFRIQKCNVNLFYYAAYSGKSKNK